MVQNEDQVRQKAIKGSHATGSKLARLVKAITGDIEAGAMQIGERLPVQLGFYLTARTECVLTGLRIGYLAAVPRRLVLRAGSLVRVTS